MLTHLVIKNYALIKTLEISPSSNLNMITGETGAGKSIMLGAVGLLLGNRADTKALLNENEKCVVEGHFDLGGYDLQAVFEHEDLDYEKLSIIRREISTSGKSRAFINDAPVTLDVLRKIGVRLMDIHSQHETLHLGKHTFQLEFIDAYAGTLSKVKAYQATYRDYREAQEKLGQLQKEKEELKKEADYENFLLEELANAKLVGDEQEELEGQVELMEHAEEIKTKLNAALEALSTSDFSSLHGLQEANGLLQQLGGFSKNYQELGERLNSAMIEVSDITRELEKAEESVEFDPQQTQLAQDRLSLLYHLQQKHNVQDIASLLTIQEELQKKADRSFHMEEELQEAQRQVDQFTLQVDQQAQALSEKRALCFQPLEKELTRLLQKVGIPEASLKIENTQEAPGPKGIDKINILFSANKGVPPQELSKVASGGEFSRLMFCVKYILADRVALPTIIFDEIDTGVSGEIALKLGDMMKSMAEKHQLITISHLPQVAAKGDLHYFVYKDSSDDRSISRIKELTDEERVEEIAKMIGGDRPSTIAFDNARELMGINT